MNRTLLFLSSTVIALAAGCAFADLHAPLTVVEQIGGVPAAPYYREIQPRAPAARGPQALATPRPARPFAEESALPVKSVRLSPGAVARRAIRAPGLTPLFIVGDDARSRAWLRTRYEQLHTLGAAGIVVNVETLERLDNLRRLAPDLLLSPSAGDELAQRLALSHYPVLITATAIEQ